MGRAARGRLGRGARRGSQRRPERARIGLAAAGIALVLVFPSPASAYDLSASDAVAKTKAYAQRIVDDPRTPFSYYRVSCPPMFPHQRTCTVNYDTPQTRAEEARRQAAWVCPRLPGPVQPPCEPRRPKRLAPWACTERVLAYLKPHSHSIFAPFGPYPVYLKHVSAPCGPTRLLGG